MASPAIGGMRQEVEQTPENRPCLRPGDPPGRVRSHLPGPNGPGPTRFAHRTSGKLNSLILSAVVGFAQATFSQEARMKKVLLVLTLVGLGFLAWRYFSNEPV
jgi:hypothetical protein